MLLDIGFDLAEDNVGLNAKAEEGYDMMKSCRKRLVAGVAVGLSAGGTAHAATIATYVSGAGTDAGTCSLTAPCRSVQFALGQTLTSGAVHAIDAADYGAVSITRAVRLVGVPGASLTRQASAPIVAISSASGKVEISGFILDGGYAPAIAIAGISSKIGNLTVKNCIVRNTFQSPGILVDAQSPGKVVIEDTLVEHAGSIGILTTASAGQTVLVSLTRVTVSYSSAFGYFAGGAGLNSVVYESSFSHNGGSGIAAMNGATVALHGTMADFNVNFGVINTGSKILSAGNNSFSGNGNGAASGTVTLEGMK